MNTRRTLCDASADVEIFSLAYDPASGSKLTSVKNSISGLRGTNAALPGHKLYIVTTPGTIQYVGRTTDIVRRLRHGHQCSIKSRNGYHGYKWLMFDNLSLFVCYLSGLDAIAAAADISPQILVERLEAELVFYIRAITGQWPASQHEIHFHNLASQPELARLTTQTAKELYAVLALGNIAKI